MNIKAEIYPFLVTLIVISLYALYQVFNFLEHPQVEDDIYLLDNDYISSSEDGYETALTWTYSWTHHYKPTKKLKLMFFDKFFWYQIRMDRYFYDWIEAAQVHPDIEVTLWGPGFEGWNDTLSSLENLRKTYGCDHFDWIIAHPEEYRNIPELPEKYWNNTNYKNINEMRFPDSCGKTKIFHEMHDCFGHFCERQYHQNSHIISFRYSFIPFELFNVKIPHLQLLDHAGTPRLSKLFRVIPDCANAKVFIPIPWENKTSEAVLFGRVAKNYYRLRQKVKSGIDRQRINATQYVHPGYTMPYNKSLSPPLYYSRQNPEINNSVVNQEIYAKQLALTKICIFDSSIARKLIRKYMEAFMAGCVVAADLPLEMEELFGEIVINLHSDMDEWDIGSLLKKSLANDQELQRKAAKGLLLAREYFSCELKVDRMLEAIDEYNNGFRGYQTTNGFRIGCHSYDVIHGHTTNPWCRV